jgi:PAS domain-containing protein
VDESKVHCLGAFAGGKNGAMSDLRAQSLSLDDAIQVLPKQLVESSTFVASPGPDRDERALLAASAGLSGVLLVPVRADERVFGILELWRGSSVAPDRGAVSLMEELCSRLGHFMDRAHMLASLAQREASLRALLLALPDVIYHVDRAGNTISPRTGRGEAFSIFAPPDNLLEIIPQSEHDEMLAAILRAMDTGSVQQYGFSTTTDGRRYDARIAPMYENAAVVVLRDVT